MIRHDLGVVLDWRYKERGVIGGMNGWLSSCSTTTTWEPLTISALEQK